MGVRAKQEARSVHTEGGAGQPTALFQYTKHVGILQEALLGETECIAAEKKPRWEQIEGVGAEQTTCFDQKTMWEENRRPGHSTLAL